MGKPEPKKGLLNMLESREQKRRNLVLPSRVLPPPSPQLLDCRKIVFNRQLAMEFTDLSIYT